MRRPLGFTLASDTRRFAVRGVRTQSWKGRSSRPISGKWDERAFIVISITEEPRGLRMTFSSPGTGWREFSVIARNLAECHTAITHHYNKPHAHALLNK